MIPVVVTQRRCLGQPDSPDGPGNSGPGSSGGRRREEPGSACPAPAADVEGAARGSNKMDEKRRRDWWRFCSNVGQYAMLAKSNNTLKCRDLISIVATDGIFLYKNVEFPHYLHLCWVS